MHVLSVNVGRPMIVVKGGRQYSTAINRRAVEGPLALTAEGFEGDRVSDLRFHGGPDKAACVYPFDHYASWSGQLGRELTVPSFGENLTTAGWLEDQVAIGDTCRVGGAIVQVTQPRQPCFKLAGRLDEPRIIKWINDRRWTGFYVRVIEAGAIQAGDAIELIQQASPRVTIARAMEIMLDKEAPAGVIDELLAVAALSEAWRTTLQERVGISKK